MPSYEHRYSGYLMDLSRNWAHATTGNVPGRTKSERATMRTYAADYARREWRPKPSEPAREEAEEEDLAKSTQGDDDGGEC